MRTARIVIYIALALSIGAAALAQRTDEPYPQREVAKVTSRDDH
jgi:hypothetical protein